MLDQKQFKLQLRTISTSVIQMRKGMQGLCLYVIQQACEHSNVSPATDLLRALTVDKGNKQEYITMEAQRILLFVSAFAPVTIQPNKGIVKFVKRRKMEWRGEDGYPQWFDWSKTVTPARIKEVDGISLLLNSVTKLVKNVKEGKVKITEDSRPEFENIVTMVEKIISAAKVGNDVAKPTVTLTKPKVKRRVVASVPQHPMRRQSDQQPAVH